MKQQYPLRVGIMSAPSIQFILHGNFTFNGETYTGVQTIEAHLGHIRFNGSLYSSLEFAPAETSCSFTLRDVTIGVGFHWEREEDQTFLGGLRFIIEHTTIAGLPVSHENITAINLIGVEDYLSSVISSEMSSTSSMELLKAHAVTSRSWVLHPILSKEKNHEKVHGFQSIDKRVIWYERDAHSNFDVCADDHCQRYQGITRISAAADNVRKAIEATWGEVIQDKNGNVCDARFYKCCGGKTELFENAWADTHYDYLECVEDSATAGGKSFCDTNDARILSQVLNGYDQETADFYRWEVKYDAETLSKLVYDRSGIDFGTILDLRPIRRGPSYRLVEMEVVGTKRTMTIGKELEIRRILSKSHLYSSAFDVEKTEKDGHLTFTLKGRGWGHGVGLCQIGAAVMAEEGYEYKDIVAHYFPNSVFATL